MQTLCLCVAIAALVSGSALAIYIFHKQMPGTDRGDRLSIWVYALMAVAFFVAQIGKHVGGTP